MSRQELEKILGVKLSRLKDKGCYYLTGRDWSTQTTIGKRTAHRLSYELCNGPLLPGLMICHKCDRRGCVNPEHLFQGTAKMNHWDSVNKGRQHHRWKHGNCNALKEVRRLRSKYRKKQICPFYMLRQE